MSKLIVIRGNSGTGKSTVAQAIRKKCPTSDTMLVSQDMIRLEILNVKDSEDNKAIELIYNICNYGKKNCKYVILEGILAKEKYQVMLRKLIEQFEEVDIFYLKAQFKTTVQRNNYRSIDRKFSVKTLKSWWLEDDFLGVQREKIINSEGSLSDVVNHISQDIGV